MRHLIALFAYAASAAADVSCLTAEAVLRASENKPSATLVARSNESVTARINETLALFDSTAAATLADDQAAVAASFFDVGMTPRQLRALEEKAAGRPQIWNGLDKDERDLLDGVDSDYLKQLTATDMTAVRGKLRDRYVESMKELSAKDLANPQELAQELNRTHGAEARAALDGLKRSWGDKVSDAVRACLKNPDCLKAAAVPHHSKKPTVYTGLGDTKALPFMLETADKHVQDHIAPDRLLKIVKDLSSAQTSDQTKAAARELAGAAREAQSFNRLPPERRKQLEALGIDAESWDFVIARRSKPPTTFYRDQDHLAEIRKTIEERCRKGECDYKDLDPKTGSMTVRLEKDGVQVRVVYCAQLGTQCSSPGVVKTYFPECGPGLVRLAVGSFLDAMRTESYASAAKALQSAECKSHYASR